MGYSGSKRLESFVKSCLLLILVFLSNVGICVSDEAMQGDIQYGKDVHVKKELNFPADHYLHQKEQQEWWYLTANLKDKNENDYGIQFTLFTYKPPRAESSQRIFFAHASVSSESGFAFSERYARAAMGHAGVTGKPWGLYIDHWKFIGTHLSPLPGNVSVKEKEFSYDLKLGKAVYVPIGESGYSKKNKSGSLHSYYYSAPHISVEGIIELHGEKIEVSGNAWLDREWSSAFSDNKKLGWDWFSMRFQEGFALMIYRVRSDEGTSTYAAKIQKDGKIYELNSDLIRLTATDNVNIDGKEYSISWKVEVPELDLDVNMTPINMDQYMGTLIPYWEGAMKIEGTHNGEGYLELFGER